MRSYYFFLFFLVFPSCVIGKDIKSLPETLINQEKVVKKVLENGLTVLVHESHVVPKVSMQMWYNVGSKDELLSEKGIAHLIEHMIFKGTDLLSESDIGALVHKLSGRCGAFTSFDYTGYWFNLPTHNWQKALPIIADCMVNCAFKEDMLSSEMKAVIQELKMYKDQYDRSLMEEMMGMVFTDHPYHYPVVGYKHDLWNVSGKDLHDFYKKHYHPNNATLVVVGDVNAQEVFALAQEYFGEIPRNETYHKKQHFFHKDIASRLVTLYRDVAQPTMACMFVVPGSTNKQDVVLQMLQWVLGQGKSSRLYRRLVNDTQLATNVTTSFWNLFDYGMFFIMVEPKDTTVFADIETLIAAELNDLIKNGLHDDEFERGYKTTQMSFYGIIENFKEQASAIGEAFLATGDENYIFTALQQPVQNLQKQAQEILATYFRPIIMHKGFVLPLPGTEKKEWALLQQEFDAEDTHILSARVRETGVEPASYAHQIEVDESVEFVFPRAETGTLKNGMKFFFYNNPTTPTIAIKLEFKFRYCGDPEDKQGLYNFVAHMMTEGTENYTGPQLAEAMESRGMTLYVYPGAIVLYLLKDDFEFGLDILQEIITKASFPEEEMEKVRKQIESDIKQFWDNQYAPYSFARQLVAEQLYKGHPYSKLWIGRLDALETITREELINFYQRYISPTGARMAIAGDIEQYDVKKLLEEKLHDWKATKIEDIVYPPLVPAPPVEINSPLNRDQVTLYLAQLSIDRKNPDFDKYLLFNQIFGGGVLGTRNSRLFDLREETGLFYTIQGSLIDISDEQPGMFLISTLVSLDRLQEAEKAIKETIDTVVDTVTEEELEEAKRAVINSLVDNFATNSSIASAFLFLGRYNFPADYFDKRAAQLNKVTLEEMKTAVRKILDSRNLVTVRVGRV